MIRYLMRSSAGTGGGLTDVRPVCGPGEKISEEEVEATIGKTKLVKAAGPSCVMADISFMVHYLAIADCSLQVYSVPDRFSL